MTALQNIIKEAKSLRAKYPTRYSKWTDYVKQASAIYASKHKGKSPVGKKKISGYVKTKREGSLTDVIYSRIEKPIRKKIAHKKVVAKKVTHKKQGVLFGTTIDKDSKSHNVNIRVLSGIKKNYKIGSVKINIAEKVKHDLNKLQLLERELMQLEKMRNDPRLKDIKSTLFLEIKILKSVIKEQKTHIKELKKHI